MPAYRTALHLASLAAVSALALGCSAKNTEAEPASPTGEAPVASSESAMTTTEAPTPTPEVEVPAGVVGSGCTDYAQKVPNGPGSLVGMNGDPVAVALANSSQLTTFTGALSGRLNPEVDLTDTLSEGEYTVFAPTDTAFGKLDPALIDTFKTDSAELTSVLEYHVVKGELDPSAVVGELATLQGQPLTVSGSGGDLRVNNAGVACGGITTANATVYLLDTVLLPPPPAATTSTTSATSGTETTATPTP